MIRDILQPTSKHQVEIAYKVKTKKAASLNKSKNKTKIREITIMETSKR